MPTRQPAAGVPFHRLLSVERGAGWRLVVAVISALLGLVLTTVAATVGVYFGARLVGFDDFTIDPQDGINAGELLGTNLGLALLIPLAGGLAWLVYRVRPPWLASTRPGLRLRWLLTCVGMASAVWAVFLILGTAGAAATRKGPFDLAVVGFLAVVLLTTPLQAAGEEYLFRGLLLQALGATRLPTLLCCAISGLVFATAHLQFAPPLFADRFLIGVVFAWLAIRTGGIEAGIAIHAVKNLAVLVPAGLLDDLDDALDPTGVTWLPLALDTVLLGIVVPWIVRRSRHQPQPSP